MGQEQQQTRWRHPEEVVWQVKLNHDHYASLGQWKRPARWIQRIWWRKFGKSVVSLISVRRIGTFISPRSSIWTIVIMNNERNSSFSVFMAIRTPIQLYRGKWKYANCLVSHWTVFDSNVSRAHRSVSRISRVKSPMNWNCDSNWKLFCLLIISFSRLWSMFTVLCVRACFLVLVSRM